MIELFDSHAHYDDEKFDEDREKILADIYNDGITKFISAGYDLQSSIEGLEFANKYNYIYTTVGISQNDVKETEKDTIKEIEKIEELLIKDLEESKKQNKKSKIVGIGEIGLDYYWNTTNKKIQQIAFIKQIELANKYNLPIIIHSRDAVSDTLDILKNKAISVNKGIFHCCPLNRELVKEALKIGFYISFAGPVTFKNSKNAEEIANMVPLDKMLIETDSPYLAPEPKRGTRNDSRNVRYIAEKIAAFRKTTIEEIGKHTYENAEKIFKIKSTTNF